MSSGTRVYEASVQVCRCDVAYDHPSSRFTDSGRLKANNKCKLQSEEQIGAGEDNCSIMALCACACVCARACVCILYNSRGVGYQMPGADVTSRHNRTSEVLQY